MRSIRNMIMLMVCSPFREFSLLVFYGHILPPFCMKVKYIQYKIIAEKAAASAPGFVQFFICSGKTVVIFAAL